MNLYYKTYEECKSSHPNCEITECLDYEYINLINKIINKSEFLGYDYKNRKIYKYKNESYLIHYRILEEDELFLDCIEYKFFNNYSHMQQSMWTICNIKEFYETYVNTQHLSFEVHNFRLYGQPKLSKPKELNKIPSCFSIDFITGKCSCQCFIKEDDLWIKHRDWFSGEMKLKDEDFGAPLEVIVKKYTDKSKSNKFVYFDAWGDIVCRNEAWIVFRNIIPKIKTMNQNSLSKNIMKVFCDNRRVNEFYFIGTHWEFFFERLAKTLYGYVTEE